MEFCGVPFKNPVVIASLETTNSPDLMKQAFDYGASGAIIKTLTDIEDMAVLTMNSKYAIMNDRGDIIKGKVPRDFKFYSRSGYSSTYYKDWIPYLREIGEYDVAIYLNADLSVSVKVHIVATEGEQNT